MKIKAFFRKKLNMLPKWLELSDFYISFLALLYLILAIFLEFLFGIISSIILLFSIIIKIRNSYTNFRTIDQFEIKAFFRVAGNWNTDDFDEIGKLKFHDINKTGGAVIWFPRGENAHLSFVKKRLLVPKIGFDRKQNYGAIALDLEEDIVLLESSRRDISKLIGAETIFFGIRDPALKELNKKNITLLYGKVQFIINFKIRYTLELSAFESSNKKVEIFMTNKSEDTLQIKITLPPKFLYENFL